MTITEFLMDRIAEDETHARDFARNRMPPKWDFRHGGNIVEHVDWQLFSERFDAARVLAECEANRAIIEMIWGYEEQIDSEWGRGRGQAQMEADGIVPDPLRSMASVHADHPDYDLAWKVDA